MDKEKVQRALAEGGYKYTKQREAIYETLLQCAESHLSPEQLYSIVNENMKDIGIATVYRTLQIFEELGLVYKVDFGDNCNRYEITDASEAHQHHHLICTKCNRVQEVKIDLLEELENKIERTYDFTIVDHNLKFYGLCSDCK